MMHALPFFPLDSQKKNPFHYSSEENYPVFDLFHLQWCYLLMFVHVYRIEILSYFSCSLIPPILKVES